MNNLYDPYDDDEDDDAEDEDEDEDEEDDDEDEDDWNGHYGEDDGLEDEDGDGEEDEEDGGEDDGEGKDNDKDGDDGEDDGFGEDTGDGFGEEQNPDGTKPDDEDKKKKKKDKDEDVDVEGKAEGGNRDKKIEKAIKKNATTFATWMGMLAVGNHPVDTCPGCHKKSIYMSKTATDLGIFGCLSMIIGSGFRFVFFCMNNYDECKYSYQNGKCFYSNTPKPSYDAGPSTYPLWRFRNCEKKSIKKKKK